MTESKSSSTTSSQLIQAMKDHPVITGLIVYYAISTVIGIYYRYDKPKLQSKDDNDD